MNETSQIRKSLYKLYWYDKNSYEHYKNYEMLIYFFIIYLILSIIAGYLYSLNITIASLAVLLGGIIAFKLYNSSHYRYFRLIKRITQIGNNERESYIIQTYISTKKIEEFSKDKNVKWKTAKDYSELEEAECYFDQKTIKKEVTETVISKVKRSLRNHNNNFGHRFIEIHNINRLQLRPFVPILWLLGFILFSVVFFSTFFSFFYKDPILFLTKGFPVIIGIIVVNLFYTLNYRYHRLIERTVTQGRYKDTNIYIQSFITRKKIKEIGEEKDRRWTDFYIANNNRYDYIESAKYRFNEATSETKVTDITL